MVVVEKVQLAIANLLKTRQAELPEELAEEEAGGALEAALAGKQEVKQAAVAETAGLGQDASCPVEGWVPLVPDVLL